MPKEAAKAASSLPSATVRSSTLQELSAGDYGCININGSDAWVSMAELVYAGESEELTIGDINGDGTADAVDLALLNDYIRCAAELPQGVSILRSCEIEAADINCDGTINSNDVLIFLMQICE